jgi:hypothetical protein
MGFRSRIAPATLADANETHDWRIFADFAQHLIGIARSLHAEAPLGVDPGQHHRQSCQPVTALKRRPCSGLASRIPPGEGVRRVKN